MNRVFGPDGRLAQAFPGFEPRPSQLAMAEAVDALVNCDSEGGAILAAEAGTGTGKTLAYLVPAVLSRRRVVVSTNTITLQDQIIGKDLPLVKRLVAPDIRVLCVKGRQNYICLYRWKQLFAEAQTRVFERGRRLEDIAHWLATTGTGDRSEISWLADNDTVWREVHAAAGHCFGSDCPDFQDCFITRLRREAARADLLVVNHHLFFADLALRRGGFAELLPRYEAVIFDEAHHLESVVTSHFGLSVSQYQLSDLAWDMEKLAGEQLPPSKAKKIVAAAAALSDAAGRLAGFFPATRGRFPLEELDRRAPDWCGAVEDIGTRLGLCRKLAEDTGLEIFGSLGQRAQELAGTLNLFTMEAREEEGPTSRHVFWGERRERAVALYASPIEVAPALQRHLYAQTKKIAFISATLSVNGDFGYFSRQLGLDKDILSQKLDSITLASPFDYPARTRLYVPENSFPEPGSSQFTQAAAERMAEILAASRGRSLVLFTSLQNMQATRAVLVEKVPYPVLTQGESPRHILLQKFREDTASVLLAVASFWEGVDVPGESLSCVIIDKLPFEVPSDPVIMARINALKEAGGNPFYDFQVPRAVLTLRQGVGRLLRSAGDSGLIAVCDVRLFSKGYGRRFLGSLPPSPVVRSMDQVRDFFTPGAGNKEKEKIRP